MKICEIFASIQGESTYAGLACTFIRMTGCNLRCSYCDTTYAYDEGMELSEDEILKKVKAFGINLVEITGGEPLLQKETLHLVKRLTKEKYKVLIETNGSISIKDLHKNAVIILDVKTPGSKMSEKMDFSNLDYLKAVDEVKFVITSRKDYDWASSIIKKYNLSSKCQVLFSPAIGYIEPEKLASWMIEDKIPVRLNLQIHKYIYGNEKRGV